MNRIFKYNQVFSSKSYFYILLIIPIIISCSGLSRPEVKNVTIQPFKGVDPNIIEALADSLRKYHPQIRVAPPIDLPKFAFYSPRNRFKADSILKFLDNRAKPGETIIGITTKDISTKNGPIADWGVIGLAYRPGNECIVSTFRLKKSNLKSQLFKASIHELGHSTGLPHCPNLQCYMRDAKGANPIDEENSFCTKCKKYLQTKRWKI
ncbi:MAG: hypothetical protein ACRCVT_10435 [Leadbetterella sp.]